jgi:hypothetical protein
MRIAQPGHEMLLSLKGIGFEWRLKRWRTSASCLKKQMLKI